eukprot:CAMPEP_0183737282 /NCGR_PEP_ID=MMETSP0737-20130205/51501_1 /TAXON_ID=385413 /ORGANISM="Thalassiosira miniscula, Strain CCMP1093" /LENGTH=280 /DNA_ID=CAMNT_0025971517 /DNA_START=157 /DNA_END=996 /DNA_ORIENTATION=-
MKLKGWMVILPVCGFVIGHFFGSGSGYSTNPPSHTRPFLQGQLYTAQNVATSIDRLNLCPSHPVRCRDGLIELAVQLKNITNYPLIGPVAEIGVFQGDFAKHQAWTWAPRARPGAIYHLIDAWQFRPDDTGASARDKNFKDDTINQQNMQLTRDNMMSIPDMSPEKYKLHRNFSVPAAQLFEDEYFDYIYIDALHTYEAAYNDMVAYWPKLKHGGLFAGDDFGDAVSKDGPISVEYEWGVRKAAQQFAKEMRLPLYGTITPHHSGDVLYDGSPCYAFPAW